MNIHDFLGHLGAHPDAPLALELPDGTRVPAHYHITEVGHVSKRFIDCGGTRRTQETCLLQTWVHDDFQHRLLAGKLADIFQRASDILPNRDLPVEIEHESEVVAQFPLESASLVDGTLVLHLGSKHTDCLARGICLPNECAPEPPAKLQIKSISTPAVSCCTPASGCC